MRIFTGINLFLVASFFFIGTCAHASEMITSVKRLQVGDAEASAELWGDKIKGGYTDNLLIIVKDKDQKVMTAYAPTIKGGYNCRLELVNVRNDPQKNQLLISAGRGDWREATEYRLLDFSNKKKVRELLTADDNSGVVKQAAITEAGLNVTFFDGQEKTGAAEEWSKDGNKRLTADGIASVTVKDMDDDGSGELLVHQSLKSGKTTVAEVGSMWKYDEQSGKWEKDSYAVLIAEHGKNTARINEGADFSNGAVLPRQIILRGSECTYPVFVDKGDKRIAEQVNEILRQEYSAYMEKFYGGTGDMAFRINKADENILSMQFVSADKEFVKNYVNISMRDGSKLGLADVFDLKHPDFIPLLNLLSSNSKVKFQTELPEKWFMEDDKFFLVAEHDGKEEVTGYTLNNLFKFVKMQDLLKKS